MPVLLTSPGLLLAIRADWCNRETIALGLTALLVLVPSLLYYGGGWWQFGYRYALDCLPFIMALCATAAARHGIGWGWKALILFGVAVNLYAVYWNYYRERRRDHPRALLQPRVFRCREPWTRRGRRDTHGQGWRGTGRRARSER